MAITVVDRSKDNLGRFWIIRAGHEARFYRTFRSNNLTAIGHVDPKILNEFESGPVDLELSEKILRKYNEHLKSGTKSKSHRRTQFNQVKRFLNEVKVGDTVLTPSKSDILVGRIESSPNLAREEIYYAEGYDNRKGVCNFPLRRTVNWSRSYSRDSLPYNVERTFRNTSTIFEISDPDKLKSLNHWLHPIHIADDEIRCSLLLKQKEDIPNRELTALSGYLDRLEASAKIIASHLELGNSSIDADTLESFISSYEDYTLTTQHAFMSEGLQYIQFRGTRYERIIFAAMFSALFANSALAIEEDEETSNNINGLIKEPIAQIAREQKFQSTKESLKLTVSSKDSKDEASQTNDNVEFVRPTKSEKKIF